MDTVFFIASKVFWGVARPDSVLMLALLAGVVALWSGRAKAAGWILTPTVAIMIVLAFFPLGNFVLSPLETRFPVNPEISNPEGIIVLGGSERATLSRIWDQPQVNERGERYIATLALARAFPDARVMHSGDSGALRLNPASESGVAERIFLEGGVDPARILLEGNSRNTAENAAFSLEIAKPSGERPWVLVTSAHHMPRALSTFCAAGWQTLIPYPTDFNVGAFAAQIRFARNLHELNRGVKEWIGLVAYYATGRSASLFPKEGCSP